MRALGVLLELLLAGEPQLALLLDARVLVVPGDVLAKVTEGRDVLLAQRAPLLHLGSGKKRQ